MKKRDFQPRSEQVQTRLTRTELAKLKRLAKKWGGTPSSFLQMLLQEAK